MKFFLYLIIFVTSFSNFAQIEKVEPPFWWEGMQESTIQLMLYGKNLSQYDLELDSSKRIDVSRVENPNYLFVDLDLSEHLIKFVSRCLLCITNIGEYPFLFNLVIKSSKIL